MAIAPRTKPDRYHVILIGPVFGVIGIRISIISIIFGPDQGHLPVDRCHFQGHRYHMKYRKS